MTTKTQEKTLPKTFLDYNLIRSLSNSEAPSDLELDAILNKAMQLQGLDTKDVAKLINVKDEKHLKILLDTASKVKQEIYGKRMVLFAPLYTGNYCANNCLYCGFRKDNKNLHRVKLGMADIAEETRSLIKEGHKRILLLSGESGHHPLQYTLDALETIYSVAEEGSSIRRVNVEIAPLSVEDFKKLKEAKIGTYTCFQETYDPELYSEYHLSGPKANYEYRLNVMDRAMEAGVDDVGVGVLFGLADYRFEILSLLEHAKHLEEKYGCGPHTVSVPRIEPAPGAPITENVPFPVDDDTFKKIIAVIRIAMPYTGIILSTRESTEIREELFHYGISQVSAGSRTSPGGYTGHGADMDDNQFSLGDHRTIEEVISALVDDGYIPSFCTGCYRKGRVGNDFMDLAKPGLIKKFCMPNGLVSFAEYLLDYANKELQEKGFNLIEKLTNESPEELRKLISKSLEEMKEGKRDIYL